MASDHLPDGSELPGVKIPPALRTTISDIQRRLFHLSRIGPPIVPELVKQLEGAIEYIEQHDKENRMLLALLLQWLGGILPENPIGNEEDNLERAIVCSEAAIEIMSTELPPEEYRLRRAFLLNNLAATYDRRLSGNQAENQERAIGYYHEILRTYTREDHPKKWAETKVNLAIAHINRIIDSPATNLELALMYLYEASEVLTREQYPIEWGQVHLHMGNVYLNRICDNRTENIEEAINCYENAMEVLEYSLSLRQHAIIQRNLGQAFSIRLKNDRTQNIELARMYFDTALRIYEADEYPADHREIQLACAVLEASRGQWEEAHKAYTTARETEEFILLQAAGSAQRDRIIKEGRDAATRDGFVLTRLGRIEDAAVEIERGRAREFAEDRTLWNTNANSISNLTRRAHFEAARQRLLEKRAALDAPIPPALSEGEEREIRSERHTAFREAKANLDAIVEEIRRAKDPANFLDPALDAVTIQHAVNRGGAGHALVYLVATPWGGIALAARGTKIPQSNTARFFALDLPNLTDDFVHELAEVKLDETSGRIVGGFARAQEGNAYSTLLRQRLWPGESFRTRVESLHSACCRHGKASSLEDAAQKVLSIADLSLLIEKPSTSLSPKEEGYLAGSLADFFLKAELARCLKELSEVVMVPLVNWLHTQGVTSFTLIPCGALAAFPVGAAPVSSKSTVAETLPMSVALSARSLLHDERASTGRSGVYALGDPRPTHQELKWGEAEAHTLASLARRLRLRGQAKVHEQATYKWFTEVIPKAYIIDASCHGQFDAIAPLKSSLSLANGRRLQLNDLLNHIVDIQGVRLFILSACQTAILDMRGARDEVRSLAAGVVQAGAGAVLASLWSVNDKATYLLMVRFAQEWFPRTNQEPPAKALARAQHWLRTATNRDLQKWYATDFPESTVEERHEAGSEQPEFNPWKQETDEQVGTKQLVAIRGWRSHRYEAEEAETMVHMVAEQQDDSDACPYADPIYWAGFQITGW